MLKVLSYAAQSRLFAKFLAAILEPTLYDANLVGYGYFIQSYSHGLMLGFSGLTDRMSQLISSVVSGMITMWSLPQPHERGPMGSIPYIRLKQGSGWTIHCGPFFAALQYFYYNCLLFWCTVLRKEGLYGQAPLFNVAKATVVNELKNFNFTQLAFRYTRQYLQK